jgi:hypothetical protein
VSATGAVDWGWEVFAFEEGFFLGDCEEGGVAGLACELILFGGCGVHVSGGYSVRVIKVMMD